VVRGLRLPHEPQAWPSSTQFWDSGDLVGPRGCIRTLASSWTSTLKCTLVGAPSRCCLYFTTSFPPARILRGGTPGSAHSFRASGLDGALRTVWHRWNLQTCQTRTALPRHFALNQIFLPRCCGSGRFSQANPVPLRHSRHRIGSQRDQAPRRLRYVKSRSGAGVDGLRLPPRCLPATRTRLFQNETPWDRSHVQAAA
jgi:hypothetical protein